AVGLALVLLSANGVVASSERVAGASKASMQVGVMQTRLDVVAGDLTWMTSEGLADNRKTAVEDNLTALSTDLNGVGRSMAVPGASALTSARDELSAAFTAYGDDPSNLNDSILQTRMQTLAEELDALRTWQVRYISSESEHLASLQSTQRTLSA